MGSPKLQACPFLQAQPSGTTKTESDLQIKVFVEKFLLLEKGNQMETYSDSVFSKAEEYREKRGAHHSEKYSLGWGFHGIRYHSQHRISAFFQQIRIYGHADQTCFFLTAFHVGRKVEML